MDDVTKLLGALATIAWPIIVIVMLIIFRPAVAGIIESAKSRKFTLKIGGQELTMEEANEQQRTLIGDLQNQLLEIRKRLDNGKSLAAPEHIALGTASPPAAILWVDDRPKNNSYFIDELTKLGVKVDLALSTQEGVARSQLRKYDYVLSDMTRFEDGALNSDAGLDLLRAVREDDRKVPFIIYCGARAAREYALKAKEIGATAITSSATELAGLLKLDRLKAAA